MIKSKFTPLVFLLTGIQNRTWLKRDFSPKLLVVALVVATGMCLSTPFPAFAVGPIGPGGVPGGVTVVDNDVSGETWGRAGGRSVTYTVNNPSEFTSMTWGAVGVTPVLLAFDNNVNAPGETLGLVNVTNGVAVWTGQAAIPLSTGGSLTLETRFTLTVVDGSNTPIPLASPLGGHVVGMNVLSPGGPFTANLLFEANHNGSHGLPPGWTPALDLFDALPTLPGNPPGTTGPVLTTFESGFFFEETTETPIDDHDQNMFSQTNMIKEDISDLEGKLEHFQLEALPRLITAETAHQNLLNAFNQLPGDHQSILNAINQVSQSLQDINLPNDVVATELMLILFGLAPCPPEAGALCDTATFISDLAKKEIKIQSVMVSGGSSPRWLLTTVDGELVDVDLDRVLAITTKPSTNAADVTDMATPVPLTVGLLEVSVSLPPHSKKAKVFQIDLDFSNDTDIVAQGSVLISSKHSDDDD